MEWVLTDKSAGRNQMYTTAGMALTAERNLMHTTAGMAVMTLTDTKAGRTSRFHV